MKYSELVASVETARKNLVEAKEALDSAREDFDRELNLGNENSIHLASINRDNAYLAVREAEAVFEKLINDKCVATQAAYGNAD